MIVIACNVWTLLHEQTGQSKRAGFSEENVDLQVETAPLLNYVYLSLERLL